MVRFLGAGPFSHRGNEGRDGVPLDFVDHADSFADRGDAGYREGGGGVGDFSRGRVLEKVSGGGGVENSGGVGWMHVCCFSYGLDGQGFVHWENIRDVKGSDCVEGYNAWELEIG